MLQEPGESGSVAGSAGVHVSAALAFVDGARRVPGDRRRGNFRVRFVRDCRDRPTGVANGRKLAVAARDRRDDAGRRGHGFRSCCSGFRACGRARTGADCGRVTCRGAIQRDRALCSIAARPATCGARPGGREAQPSQITGTEEECHRVGDKADPQETQSAIDAQVASRPGCAPGAREAGSDSRRHPFRQGCRIRTW